MNWCLIFYFLLIAHNKIIKPIFEIGLYFEQEMNVDFYDFTKQECCLSELKHIYCLYENDDSNPIKKHCFFPKNENINQDKIFFYMKLDKKEKLKNMRGLEYSFVSSNSVLPRILMISEMKEDTLNCPPDLQNETIAMVFEKLIDSLINFYKPLISTDIVDKISQIFSSNDEIDRFFTNMIQNGSRNKIIHLYNLIIISFNYSQKTSYFSNTDIKLNQQKQLHDFLMEKYNKLSKQLHMLVRSNQAEYFHDCEITKLHFLLNMLLGQITICKAVFIYYNLDFKKKRL